MPDVVGLKKHLGDRDDFAVLSVSLDNLATTGQLRQTISEYGLNYPVLHVGAEDGWHGGNFDWDIEAVPSAFIITPEGTVLGSFWADEALPLVFEFLMERDSPVPTYGVEVSHEQNNDGSFRAKVKVTSPDHKPVTVHFSAGKILREYAEMVDGEWVKIDPIPDGKKWNVSAYYDIEGFESVPLEFEFDQFGDATQYVEVPAVTDSNLWSVAFNAALQIPGTEELNDGNGIVIYESSNYWAE